MVDLKIMCGETLSNGEAVIMYSRLFDTLYGLQGDLHARDIRRYGEASTCHVTVVKDYAQ